LSQEVRINRFAPRKELDTTRVNLLIRVPQVRVVDHHGQALGVIPTRDALKLAMEAHLDLVEVAPNAEPPVCRIMDYGKFKYEKSKKAKEAKKKQHTVHLKEVKLHPQTDEHDLTFKMKHAREFLVKGDRVKVTVVFRGREITHLEFGRQLLARVNEQLLDVAMPEQVSRMEGRNMISVYLPDKLKIKQYVHKMEIEERRAAQALGVQPAAGGDAQATAHVETKKATEQQTASPVPGESNAEDKDAQ
jgi:translation initiation factor IF-3